jgi:predicted phosphodiesterase
MRVGAFADVHGNLPALKSVLADGLRQGVDRWLCLGDLAFRGPAPAECIDTVRSLRNCAAVMGNTEEWLPTGPPPGEGSTPEFRAALRRWWEWTIALLQPPAVEWVERLPRRVLVEEDGVRVLGVHATARGLEDRLLPWSPDELFAAAVETANHSAVVCAHIHLPYLRKIGNTPVLNCGSVGRPLDGDPRSSYVCLDLGPGGVEAIQFRRVAYDLNATAALCSSRGFPWADEYLAALRVGANF